MFWGPESCCGLEAGCGLLVWARRSVVDLFGFSGLLWVVWLGPVAGCGVLCVFWIVFGGRLRILLWCGFGGWQGVFLGVRALLWTVWLGPGGWLWGLFLLQCVGLCLGPEAVCGRFLA